MENADEMAAWGWGMPAKPTRPGRRPSRTRILLIVLVLVVVIVATCRLEVRRSGFYPGVTVSIGPVVCGVYVNRTTLNFDVAGEKDPRTFRSRWYARGRTCAWAGVK